MEEFTILVPSERRQFFLDLIEQLGFDRRNSEQLEVPQSQIDEVRRRRTMYKREDFIELKDMIA
jgi:hypothetical protein